MAKTPLHPQTNVRTPAGVISCDIGIASLVEHFWRRGVETQFSCQGSGPSIKEPLFGQRAYILSYNSASLEELVTHIQQDFPLFATSYHHFWSEDEEELIPTEIKTSDLFGVERDSYYGPAPRTVLRFPSWAIPDLKLFLREL